MNTGRKASNPAWESILLEVSKLYEKTDLEPLVELDWNADNEGETHLEFIAYDQSDLQSAKKAAKWWESQLTQRGIKSNGISSEAESHRAFLYVVAPADPRSASKNATAKKLRANESVSAQDIQTLARAFADSSEGGVWPGTDDPQEFLEDLKRFDSWSETTIRHKPMAQFTDEQIHQAVDLMKTIELNYDEHGELEE